MACMVASLTAVKTLETRVLLGRDGGFIGGDKPDLRPKVLVGTEATKPSVKIANAERRV